jgi:hypothetical protein
MWKLLQIAVFAGVACALIYYREAAIAAGEPTPLSNPYLIGLLAFFAAFAVTALPVGLYHDLPRWYRNTRTWLLRKKLRPEQGLRDGISPGGAGGPSDKSLPGDSPRQIGLNDR